MIVAVVVVKRGKKLSELTLVGLDASLMAPSSPSNDQKWSFFTLHSDRFVPQAQHVGYKKG